MYLQKDKVGTLIQLAERGVEKQESEFKFKREMNLSVMSVRTHDPVIQVIFYLLSRLMLPSVWR